ncbi:MAG: PDZ domain-containing protein [Planctomycetes bacterium]|nr:PDZ domain-containing protein [Planctomycetota bacterium]
MKGQAELPLGAAGGLGLAALVALAPLAGAQSSPYEARRIDVGMDVDDARGDSAVVKSVAAGGPAEKAGIAVGDVVVRLGEHEVKGFQHFLYLTHYVLPPAKPVEVVFRHGEEEKKVALAAGEAPVVPAEMSEGGRTVFRADPEVFPVLEGGSDYLERAVVRLVERNGMKERAADLFRVLREDVDRKAGFFRLDRVTYAQRNPLRCHRVAGRLVEDLRAAEGAGWRDLPDLASEWLDSPTGSPGKAPAIVARDREDLLDSILAAYDRAEAERQRALAGLSQAEVEFLAKRGTSLASAFLWHIYINAQGQKEVEENLKAVRLAKKVDYAALGRMAACLSGLWDVSGLAAWKAALSEAGKPEVEEVLGVEGDVLAFRDTPFGAFVVGGPGTNTYRGSFALVIDVGGDDIYEGDLATSWPDSKTTGIGAVVDLAGNDRYACAGREAVLGSGWLGAGVLVDLAGDDSYEVSRLGLGFGYLGFGLLLDAGGSDTYEGGEFAQGAAWFGTGALLDLGPEKDRYRAKAFAQGFGLTKGFGLLADSSGDDEYFVGGAHASYYQDAGIFRGVGQGLGIGLRWVECGGLGVLLDRKGNDRYEAGEFSQGGGYFMALGVLADDEGDDVYQVCRYGQGFGCHSAAGALLDGAGADRYQGKTAANQGAAWDAGVGVLVDSGGDDEYTAEGLSVGAGAQNGFGLLFDAGGKDRYGAGGSCLGHGGGNEYWFGRGGAPSLGVLLDLDSEGDDYGTSDRKESETRTGTDLGLFHDSPTGLLELLAGDPDVDRIIEERHLAEEERRKAQEEAARNAAARARCEAAGALLAASEFRGAIDAFRKTAREYAGVEWGRIAAERAAAIEGDPVVQRKMEERRIADECRRWITLGKNYLYNGNREAAAREFRKVIEAYPDTPYAREAREWLSKAGG